MQLSSLWRKFLYGSNYGGTRFLLSGYPQKDSRIMLHRQIAERIRTLAPFLSFDDDPYIVLNEGRLYWIIDAYTTSAFYPYSEPFKSVEEIEYERGIRDRRLFNETRNNLRRKNYIRNSVKITVDAYSGEVNLYIFEEALSGLYQKQETIQEEDKEITPGQIVSNQELINRANNAFENYLKYMNEKDFRQAGEALEELQQTLEKLTENKNH